MLTPLIFIAGLAAFLALPRIHTNTILTASVGGAAAVLLFWYAWLWWRGRPFKSAISLRPQHYLQAIAHTSIFVYWAIYWPPIQDAAWLIAAQIVFAYAFDMLLSWTRKHEYVLGFGPFPIIYSTNLFLRFKDDWFYWQFAMVAVGFLAKELIRWHRDGKRVHIFNPSSFPLALFSLALIVTGMTNITWGEAIASELFVPPNIYLFIFLVALPGQFMFGVSTMTLPAVLTTYLFSLAYLQVTGTYYFIDSNVPIAVFLGMHLLFTDPSTAPRTDLGRIIFGVIYGLSVVALWAILDWAGAPTFYDKLLQVPLMNLMVRALDRWTTAGALARLSPARLMPRAWSPRLRGFAYATAWVLTFAAISSANGLGDHHPGHSVPFWRTACAEGRTRGCDVLALIESRYCAAGSGWACNELAIIGSSGKSKTPPAETLFRGACAAGLRAGCDNADGVNAVTGKYRHEDPSLNDYAWLLQEGKGPVTFDSPLAVYTAACDQGFSEGCTRVGYYFVQEQRPPDFARARALWERACEANDPQACANLGLMFNNGDGVAKDRTKALALLKQACDLGLPNACSAYKAETGQK